MKKWILSAAMLLALCGFAAAQSTPAKATPKAPVQKTVKKGTETADKKATKKDTTVQLPRVPVAVSYSDTLYSVPVVKNREKRR